MWFPGRWDKGWDSRAVAMAKGHRQGERESSEAQKPREEVLRSTGRQSHISAPRVGQGSPLGVAEHHSAEQGVQAPGTCPRPSSESVEMLSKARAVYALPGSLDTVAEDYKYC